MGNLKISRYYHLLGLRCTLHGVEISGRLQVLVKQWRISKINRHAPRIKNGEEQVKEFVQQVKRLPDIWYWKFIHWLWLDIVDRGMLWELQRIRTLFSQPFMRPSKFSDSPFYSECLIIFWIKLKSRTLNFKKKFSLLQWKPFKSEEKCFLFHFKALFLHKIFKVLSWFFVRVK